MLHKELLGKAKNVKMSYKKMKYLIFARFGCVSGGAALIAVIIVRGH